MIKTSIILFVLFYLVTAHSQQTIDKLNSNQLKLPKETISKALSIDATGQVKSSSTSSVELGYLSGTSSNVQDQINDKANDADAVHLTDDESISGVKTLTGKLVTSSTVNASIPCPVMTQTQRDAIAIPMVGDCVFNSDTSLSNIYDGAIWKAMGGSGGGISLWVTANGYAVDDVVIESNNIYICLTAHTSGTFATDLASLYWLRLSTDVTGATGLLPLATGGTNKSIMPVDGSIIYSDIDSLELLGPGTSGQILQSNGSAAPSWGDKTDYSVTNALETSIGTNQVLLETGNKNILTNPSFEHSTFDSGGWVNSAGSFTENFTFKLDGAKSARLVLSSQTMSLTQSSVLYQSNFADGVQGIATVRIKSNVALKVCSIQAGTVSTSNCVNVSADNKWGLYKVPFILGATSNGISIASTGAVSGTVYIDDAFVGAVDLKQDFSAANTQSSTLDQSVTFGAVAITGALTVSSGSGVYSYNSSTGVYTLLKNATVTVTNAQSAATATAIIPMLFVNGVLRTLCHSPSAINQWCEASYTGKHLAGEYFTVTNGQATSNNQRISFMATENVATSVYTSNNADTDWRDCGLTGAAFTGFGSSVPTPTLQCKRQGSDLLMKGKFVAGTGTTAVEARMALPVWNGAQLVSAGSSVIPNIQIAGILGSSVTATTYFGLLTLIEPSVSYVTFGAQQSTTSAINKAVGNSIAATGTTLSLTARIPINGWENSNIIIGSFNGLQTCTDTLACTDVFSAFISSTGVVSQENVDWINGNCTLATSTFTCNYNTLGLSNPLNCSVSTIQANTAVIIHASSSTQLQTRTYVETSSSLTPYGHTVVCQKQGADYIGKTAMAVASDQNVRSIGSTNVDIQSVYFGSGANCTNACTTGNCTICTQVGSKITSISWVSTGQYNVNGIDGTKYICTGQGGGVAGAAPYTGILQDKGSSTSTFVRIVNSSANAVRDTSYASMTCIGIP